MSETEAITKRQKKLSDNKDSMKVVVKVSNIFSDIKNSNQEKLKVTV